MANNFLINVIIAVIVELIAVLISRLLAKKPVLIIGTIIAISIAVIPLVKIPTSPYIRVVNKLGLPINIYIEGKRVGKVQSRQEKIFFINSYPVEVKWDALQLQGIEAVHLSETDSSVQNSETLVVDNEVNGKKFFLIKLTNNTKETCQIVINDGYLNNLQGGSLRSQRKNVVSGYFPLDANSNVTLYCELTNYWWGNRPYHEILTKPLMELVETESGILELSIP